MGNKEWRHEQRGRLRTLYLSLQYFTPSCSELSPFFRSCLALAHLLDKSLQQFIALIFVWSTSISFINLLTNKLQKELRKWKICTDPSYWYYLTMYFLKCVCKSHKQSLCVNHIFALQMILGIYVIHVVFLNVYTI